MGAHGELTIFQGSIGESIHEQRAWEGQDDGVPGPAAPARSMQGCGGGRPGTWPLVLGAAPRLGGCWQRRVFPLGPLLGPRACSTRRTV